MSFSPPRHTGLRLYIVPPFLFFIRLAYSKCKSLMFRSSRLSSVCLSRVRSRKLSEIDAKFRRLYRKSVSLSKNMTSSFAWEVAKYPKSSPKPHNIGSVPTYIFAPSAMQLLFNGPFETSYLKINRTHLHQISTKCMVEQEAQLKQGLADRTAKTAVSVAI